MGARVGIPRTLAYYTYYPFWQALLTGLGATCVVSRPTTKATLDAGIETAVSEACVPIKLFFGHVQELIDEWRAGRIDMLFVPRLVSWDKKTVFCPKFLGLPDMVRCTWRELPPLIAPPHRPSQKALSAAAGCGRSADPARCATQQAAPGFAQGLFRPTWPRAAPRGQLGCQPFDCDCPWQRGRRSRTGARGAPCTARAPRGVGLSVPDLRRVREPRHPAQAAGDGSRGRDRGSLGAPPPGAGAPLVETAFLDVQQHGGPCRECTPSIRRATSTA